MSEAELIRIEGLSKHYPIHRGFLIVRRVGTKRAVDDVTFSVRRGETLALVGESGSGKSTLSRLLLRLIRPTAGRVLFDGNDIFALPRREVRELRKRMQIVFQDPVGSFDPMHTAGYSIGYPLKVLGWGDAQSRGDRVAELLELVGLNRAHADRYPHQFSGGQRQRLGIARALAVQPEFVVLDEPVSALDVSIQAQVLNLIKDLQRDLGLTYLLVANNLNIVYHAADRVAIMYKGAVVEIGPTEAVFSEPKHPYTQRLLSAILGISGEIPEVRLSDARLEAEHALLRDRFDGCRYRWECPLAEDRCEKETPSLRAVGEDAQRSACHFAEQVRALSGNR